MTYVAASEVNIQTLAMPQVIKINRLRLFNCLSSNQVVGGSNPSGRANLRANKSEYIANR